MGNVKSNCCSDVYTSSSNATINTTEEIHLYKITYSEKNSNDQFKKKSKSNLLGKEYPNTIRYEEANLGVTTTEAQITNSNNTSTLKPKSVSFKTDLEVFQDEYDPSTDKKRVKGYIKSMDLPYLFLEILNSKFLTKGLVLKISPDCLENGLRGVKDGSTYFGVSNQGAEGDMMNDFLLGEENNESTIGRHFQIFFNHKTLCYFVKDLGEGSGCFKKLNEDLELRDNMMINIGDSYIIVTIQPEYFNIALKVFSNSSLQDAKIFSFNPKENSFLIIGRDEKCDIYIDDSMLSRNHCIIQYFEEREKWVYRDGYFDDWNNCWSPSTNSSWVYLAEEIRISDGMMLKANHTLFKVRI